MYIGHLCIFISGGSRICFQWGRLARGMGLGVRLVHKLDCWGVLVLLKLCVAPEN